MTSWQNRYPASQVCKNFVIGCCSYGQTCIYHHPDPIQLPGFNPTSPFASSQLSNSAIPHGHSPSMTDRQLSPHVPDAPLPFADQPSGYFPGYNSQVEGITPPWGYPIPIPTPPGSYKPISWRTTLCRHFVKNKGWCPVGDACGYIHDLTLHPHRPTLETKIKSKISGSNHPYNDPASSLLFTRDQGKSRVIGGGVPVGSRGSHCWAYVQGSCGMKVCRYYHPKDIQPYMKYTPCLSWSACTKGLDCPFRHPQPLQAEFPAFEAVFGPERSIPTLTEFRHIPQEINGTTYYPIIPVSVPAPVDCSNIVPYTVPYPESEPTCYPSETVRETDILQSSPSLNDSHQNSNHEVGLAMSTSAMDSHTHTEEHEFPYRPDRNQRAGHTRRVSVNVHVPNHDVQASVDSISALKTHTSRKSWGAFPPIGPDHRTSLAV